MTESFRDFEHAGWADPDVCASYDDLMSSLTTQSIGPMLDGAQVKEGSLVLDVASGAGYAAGGALAPGANGAGMALPPKTGPRARAPLPRRNVPASRCRQPAFRDRGVR